MSAPDRLTQSLLSESPLVAEPVSAGFCVNNNHGIRRSDAQAVWRIRGRLYCDRCARRKLSRVGGIRP